MQLPKQMQPRRPEDTKDARRRTYGFLLRDFVSSWQEMPQLSRYGAIGQASLTLSVSKGYTFIELLVVAAIIVILASAVMPLAKVTAQRNREGELRRSLREMRTAIDRFKDAADLGLIGSLDLKAGSENYPADLQQLVDGVTAANDATGRKLKFLRRVPIDPMLHSAEW